MENNNLQKQFTRKDILRLGREMNEAKVQVLLRWGFSIEEIANVLKMDDCVVRRIVDDLSKK